MVKIGDKRMVRARCVLMKKNKVTKEIQSCTLIDRTNKKLEITSEDIIRLIENKELIIDNIKVQNGKLIECKNVYEIKQDLVRKMCNREDKHIKFVTLSDKELESLLLKAKLIGINIVAHNENNYYTFENNDIIQVISNKTFKITNGSELFKTTKCKGIDISQVDTSEVTSMYRMFWACNTEYINISGIDTSHVTDMNSMFEKCKAKRIELHGIDTSNVRDMGFMFSNAKVQELDLKGLNTSNVINTQFMFSGCKNLKIIDLSSFNTVNIKIMNNMFSGVEADIVNLRNFNTLRLGTVICMFFGSKIKLLDISTFNL